MEEDPVISPSCLSISHAMFFSVVVEGSLFVDVDGPKDGVDVLEVCETAGGEGGGEVEGVLEAGPQEIESFIH